MNGKILMKNLIFGILFVPIFTFGQEFNFDIHNTSLSDYIKMEEKLGSERISTTTNYISFSGDAQPIIFLRKEKNIPDLMVYYYFKKKDSVMSSVLYEWDVYNFEKQDNNQKSKKIEKALIKKYNDLKNEISKDFDFPKIKRNYSNIASLNPNLFEENAIWKPNDSTEIEMSAQVSNYYMKNDIFTINPVHRIRLYIRNKSKKENLSPKLDEVKVVALEKIATDFLMTLELKDWTKSKEYLSDLIKESVTNEQFSLLIENIDFDRNLELHNSYIQKGFFDGNDYTILRYKYTDDKSSSPSEIIEITFDDKDKIARIQPLKFTKEIKLKD